MLVWNVREELVVGRDACALSISQTRAASPNSQPVTARGNGYYNPQLINQLLNGRFELNRDHPPCSDIANGRRVACINDP